MKVLILGPAYPYRGGIAAFNDRLAQSFREEGHEVEVVTFTLQYPGFLFPGKTQYSDDPPPADQHIVRKINSINPFNWIRTGIQYRKASPDLVIARFWMPFIGPSLGTICRLIRKNRHSRIIGLADNIIPHETGPGDRLLTSYFIGSCDGIIAMSESVLSDLNRFDTRKPRKYGPHPIYDHYGIIRPREEALKLLNLDPEYRYLLFFGLVREYKGLDLLLDALADSRLDQRKIRLLVAGEFYTGEEKYRKQVKDLHLGHKVIFYNRYIPSGEVENYFNACDMVVQPYRAATQSGVTQIAYHFNKTMLVTRVGGLAEMVPHGVAGYVCRPEAGEIAEAINDFFEYNKKAWFESNVSREKKKFAWNLFTRLFYDLLKELPPRQAD